MRDVSAIVRRLRAEQGQTSSDYLGILVLVALIAGAIMATPLGATIADGIKTAICQIIGDDCEKAVVTAKCRNRVTTSSDKVVGGVSIKLLSGGGSGERVIIKEEFTDGTARYTILDKAALQLALGSSGKGAGVLGVGAALSASLAAEGLLQDARIFTTSNREQTKKIDEALSEAGGLEGVGRGIENAGDVPLDFITDSILGFRLSDHVDIDGFLFDEVFGDENLPAPDEEYIGGESALVLRGIVGEDTGPEEQELSAQIRPALGGLRFTKGPRAGEMELYFQITGNAGAELKSELLGAANAGVNGKLTVTLVLGKDLKPKTLKVNATGTAAGLNELGQPGIGLSEEDVREFAVDRDVSSGQTIEFNGELDLKDPEALSAALNLLNPSSTPLSVATLLGKFATDGKLDYGIYDTKRREDTRNTDIIVAFLNTEDIEQVNTLTSLHRKAPGESRFTKVNCAPTPP